MIESLSEVRYGRSIDLRYTKTVGQRGRHTRLPNKARTVVRVNQTRMMQGRVEREKRPVIDEAVCVGVDIAKDSLDLFELSSNHSMNHLPHIAYSGDLFTIERIAGFLN